MTAGPARIPLAYFEGFLDFLARERDRITVITYADLAWASDDTWEDSYAAELLRWRRRIKKDPELCDKIYVVLQHDVDSWPERSMAVARLEAERGLPSNLMVFNRVHYRRALAERGVIEYLPYELDIELLQRLEREHGFVIGYHSNAFEQALWDERAAQRRFRRDVRALRKKFDIRFFSAHGGVPSPDGRNNVDFSPSRWSSRGLRWVATGRAARFHGNYSDGGLLQRDVIPDRDLRDFVRTWKPGLRYRVLTHPQYYDEPAELAPQLADVPWYAGLFGRSPDELWAGVSTRPSG